MKPNRKQRRGFTLVELLVVIVIIAALAGLTAPMVIRQRKKADQTQAVSNARQIGIALMEFETEYGSFPDSSTAPTVVENTESTLNLGGNSANSYYRQLIAGGFTTNEEMFFAKTPYTRKPDNVITGSKALDRGEVGFGYVMNGNAAFSTAGNTSRPISVTPLIENSASGDFDKDPFDGKAVVLRMDNSVVSVQINASKKASMGGGKTLLQSGDESVWGAGVNPSIAPPQPRTNSAGSSMSGSGNSGGGGGGLGSAPEL